MFTWTEVFDHNIKIMSYNHMWLNDGIVSYVGCCIPEIFLFEFLVACLLEDNEGDQHQRDSSLHSPKNRGEQPVVYVFVERVKRWEAGFDWSWRSVSPCTLWVRRIKKCIYDSICLLLQTLEKKVLPSEIGHFLCYCIPRMKVFVDIYVTDIAEGAHGREYTVASCREAIGSYLKNAQPGKVARNIMWVFMIKSRKLLWFFFFSHSYKCAIV